MTDLLERAVETVRTLPPDVQDDLAIFLLELAADQQGVAPLSEEEHASFDESFAQASRREFATDDQVKAIWAKYGL